MQGVFIAHGLSRWRQGCSRNAPVSPRRRPGGDMVAPGVVPVYHGIWQPSRLLPESPGCIKHFKTTGDMSRFNTVHPGSPRLSTVPPRFWQCSSRSIPDHQTGMNRHLKPGHWERGLSKKCVLYMHVLSWSGERSGSLEEIKRFLARVSTEVLSRCCIEPDTLSTLPSTGSTKETSYHVWTIVEWGQKYRLKRNTIIYWAYYNVLYIHTG